MERFAMVAGCMLILAASADGVPITFDDLIAGAVVYGFDDNSDGRDEAVFAMADGSGLTPIRFGSPQTYVDGPGLGATSLLGPDLRVDFPQGAREALRVGLALDSSLPDSTALLQVYNASDGLLASTALTGLSGRTLDRSGQPGGLLSLSFAGIASYALLDVTPPGETFVIDNFEGMYGTEENKGIPAPGALLLASLGIVLLSWRQGHTAF